MNFENWCSGAVSKSAKIWHAKSILYVKTNQNVSHFFFIKKYQFRSTYFVIDNFDSSPFHQFSKFNNFLWVCWFLGKNLLNFVFLDLITVIAMSRPSKGRLIQKIFFLIFRYSKTTTKFFTNFCLSLQKVVETNNKRTLWYTLVIRVYLTQGPFIFLVQTL